MIDNSLNRFAARVAPETIVERSNDDEIDSFPSFAILRGSRERAVSIELRKKGGEAIAIPYGMIHRFEFDPEAGIALHCADGLMVKLAGRNFKAEVRPGLSLFGALVRYLVLWVCETDRAAALAGDASTVVEKISW